MKSRTRTRIALLCLVPTGIACAGIATPGPEAVDEFYPMSADRPDTTESALTTQKGHWQFELETVSVSLDGKEQTEDWGSVNIKYGLSANTDLQLVTPAWHTGDGADGWADTEVRFKWNLTGQEHYSSTGNVRPQNSPVAVALMPFIKLPTANHRLGNGDVEGGLIIPITFSKLSLATMIEADVIRNEDDDGYTGSFTLSAAYGFDLTKQLAGFAELVANMPLDSAAETYFDAGLIYQIRHDWTLDAGINIGLNDEATDLRFFTGMSRRF